ncbi:MAG TPA: hypothetical protein VHU92_18065 [Streptosporangiaceae bacterium]|jgi:hypothetical protein|nr:hypothetical protein [Streptosporangiaceae bacterium]
MSPELTRQLAAEHIRDLTHEAARHAAAERPALTAPRPQLRNRIGFALVEAGLRLLADPSVTARPGLD